MFKENGIFKYYFDEFIIVHTDEQYDCVRFFNIEIALKKFIIDKLKSMNIVNLIPLYIIFNLKNKYFKNNILWWVGDDDLNIEIYDKSKMIYSHDTLCFKLLCELNIYFNLITIFKGNEFSIIRNYVNCLRHKDLKKEKENFANNNLTCLKNCFLK